MKCKQCRLRGQGGCHFCGIDGVEIEMTPMMYYCFYRCHCRRRSRRPMPYPCYLLSPPQIYDRSIGWTIHQTKQCLASFFVWILAFGFGFWQEVVPYVPIPIYEILWYSGLLPKSDFLVTADQQDSSLAQAQPFARKHQTEKLKSNDDWKRNEWRASPIQLNERVLLARDKVAAIIDSNWGDWCYRRV